VSSAATQLSMDEEAVEHAHRTGLAGFHSWKHIFSEYTQDPDQIAETLATGVPLAWCLARPSDADGGEYRWTNGVTKSEVRDRYDELRQEFHIKGWRPILEFRTGWYTMMQGVSTLYFPAMDLTTNGETVVMFPVGEDGILGELQPGVAGRLDDGKAPHDDDRLPHRRLAALAEHEQYIDFLRNEDAKAIADAHYGEAALAIRNYLTDESSLLNVNGTADIEAYYTELFQKYKVLNVEMVNRVAETWYVFADLHWVVEERTGAGRTLEFCTGEVAPLTPERKYLIRTGSGTNPVEA
jgi:hypothetical protein